MSTQRAVIFASIERYYGFVVALVTTIVISRLLTPAEVGSFSVAMALAGIASGLREFGASSFLIRTPVLEIHHQSSIFGLTLLLGFTLGISFLFLSGYLGDFFNNPEVTTILQILSLNFFLLPFGSVNNALIQRDMRFDLVARISMVAVSLSFATSVILSWYGFGGTSLAWGSVVLSCTSSFLSIFWGPGHFFIRPQLKGTREIVTFGMQSTGLSMLWEISARSPDFILGKVQNMEAAGLLSRAMGLAGNVNDLLVRGLTNLSLSHFSQIQRENGNSSQAFVYASKLVTGIGWPVFIGITIMSDHLILLLYGEKWLNASILLKIICIQQALSLPFYFSSQLVVAKGFINKQIKLTAYVTPIKLAFLVVCASWGAIGVAIGLVITQIIYTILGAIFLWPYIGITWKNCRDIAVVSGWPSILAILCGFTVIALGEKLNLSPLVELFLYIIIGGTGVICALKFTEHPLYIEIKKLAK